MNDMKEIKLVNEVAGSVVSDQMLSKVDDLTQANRKIGQLEGELRVSEQLMDQNIAETHRQLEEAEKSVTIRVIEGSNDRIINDPWNSMMSLMTNNGHNVVSIETVGTEKLNDLADAAIVAQADKDVKAAKDEQEKAEADAKSVKERAEKSVKRADDAIDELKKNYRESTKTAIERAEKTNLSTISDQGLEIKALNKEGDLLLDEKSNIEAERDLALEAMNTQLKLYKERIIILERPTKDLIAAVELRLKSWWFKRSIKRLSA